MKRSLAIVLILMLGAFMLIGCGSSVAGKYTLSSMEYEGEDITELFSMMGININDVYIELTNEGRFVMDMTAMYEGRTTGTYTVSGSTITLTSGGEDVRAVLQGNNLIIDEDGGIAVFRKN